MFSFNSSELVGNRIQLNRLLGLSNLYYIDPEDHEILQELRQVRMSLIMRLNVVPRTAAKYLGDGSWRSLLVACAKWNSEGGHDALRRAEEAFGDPEAEPFSWRRFRHARRYQRSVGCHGVV